MFFSFSSSAKGQTTQTTPLIEARQEKTREFQTQLLHYLSKSDNKSNHHHYIPFSKFTTNIQIQYFKTTFMCPRSIAGVPFGSVRRFQASLLVHTTCVRSCCIWCANCVTAKHEEKKSRDCARNPNNFVQRRSKLSAIDVTAKTIYEHFVLVPGLMICGEICHHVTSLSTLILDPTAHPATISDFPVRFFQVVASQKCDLLVTCGNSAIYALWPGGLTVCPNFFVVSRAVGRVCVALFSMITPILGNNGPRTFSRVSQGARTHDWESSP